MGVSENGGTPKSSILIGFSIINHPFWGTPIFGNTHVDLKQFSVKKSKTPKTWGPQWPAGRSLNSLQGRFSDNKMQRLLPNHYLLQKTSLACFICWTWISLMRNQPFPPFWDTQQKWCMLEVKYCKFFSGGTMVTSLPKTTANPQKTTCAVCAVLLRRRHGDGERRSLWPSWRCHYDDTWKLNFPKKVGLGL